MSIWGWAAASNERAVANARTAAVECSRRRLERAEVAEFLAGLEPSHSAAYDDAAHRDLQVRAQAR